MSKQFVLQIFETRSEFREQSYLTYCVYCGGVKIASGQVLPRDISDLLENRGPVNTAIPISDFTAILAIDYSKNVSPNIFDEPSVSDNWASFSYKQRIARGYAMLDDKLIDSIPARTRKLVKGVTAEIESLELADHEYEDVPF